MELRLKDLYSRFRDPQTILGLKELIAKAARGIKRNVKIMEVCGGHTHAIMKYGLKALLPPNVSFVHGPGCPVCVMPKERIDHAVTLASQPGVILATLGDMIRVPGSKRSLAVVRAAGFDVRALYSPLDALKIAQENPQKTVVFFAIGFETTTPMTAALIKKVLDGRARNLLFHINHVLVPPAIDAIMQDPTNQIDAFLGPSHVSVITGSQIFEAAAQNYGTPVVVSGFEPVDVLEGVLLILRQIASQRAEVEIQYKRSVTPQGNVLAQDLIAEFMQERASFRWRGLGDIARSALELRPEFARLDAEKIFKDALPTKPINDHKLCLCAEILKGKKDPTDCQVFKKVCNPQNPLGSCMVSSEGACNAYYMYG